MLAHSNHTLSSRAGGNKKGNNFAIYNQIKPKYNMDTNGFK